MRRRCCCGGDDPIISDCTEFNTWLAGAGLTTADVTISTTTNCTTSGDCSEFNGDYILSTGVAVGGCDTGGGVGAEDFAISLDLVVDCNGTNKTVKQLTLQILCAGGTVFIGIGYNYSPDAFDSCGHAWGVREVVLPSPLSDILSGTIPAEVGAANAAPCKAVGSASYSIS